MIRALFRWWRGREFRRAQAELADLLSRVDPGLLNEAEQLVTLTIYAGKSYRDATFAAMMEFLERATSHIERGYEAHSDREIAVAAVLAVRLRLLTEAAR